MAAFSSTTVVGARCNQNDFTVGATDNLGTVGVSASVHVHDFRPGHQVVIFVLATGEQVSTVKDS